MKNPPPESPEPDDAASRDQLSERQVERIEDLGPAERRDFEDFVRADELPIEPRPAFERALLDALKTLFRPRAPRDEGEKG